MCGRFFANFTHHELRQVFSGPDLLGEFEPRMNLAPTDEAAIVRLEDGTASLARARWGLVPSWAQDTRIGYRGLNARSESVERTRLFQDAFESQRCLVLASGFYEWRPEPERRAKTPFAFMPASGKRLMAFAGLWARRGELDTFTILTTGANGLVGQVHQRMPVILAPRRWRAWVSNETDRQTLKQLMAPCPDNYLTGHPIHPRVGKVQTQGPELTRAVGPPLTADRPAG